MTKQIKLYNTLTNQKENFTPLESGKAKLYSCGPTVYDYAHIGNFRSFLMSDLLTRVLQYAGYQVEKVMNITDVGHLTNDDIADADGEDKIGKKAKASGQSAQEIADFFAEKFIEDEAVLRISEPDHRPKATDYIPEQIAMTKQLLADGFAYEVNGSVYFRVEKFPEYGQLSGNTLKNLQAGARVEVDKTKENPLDFALWKKAEPEHLMQWKSPWGQGFPGWHIECSAMSRAIFGDQFDLHTGGEDNVFPHHECEIAQNACSCGQPSAKKQTGKLTRVGGVNYWLHAKHLLVNGEKMSKSKGNFYTIRDLLNDGWQGEEVRYLLLSAHYRSALNFTHAGLEQARNSIARITEAVRIFSEAAEKRSPESVIAKPEEPQKFRGNFEAALFDDLNVADAFAAVFEAIKYGLKQRDAGNLNPELAHELTTFLQKDFNQIFDVLPTKTEISAETKTHIKTLIDERNNARLMKNWKKSDEIRDQLLTEFGVELIDEAGKTSWKMQ